MDGKLIDDLTAYRLRMVRQRRTNPRIAASEPLRGLYEPLRSFERAVQEVYERQVDILMEIRMNNERVRT